jgi:hypothetical protein
MGSLLVMNDKRPRFRSDRPQLAGSRKLRMVPSHVAEPGFCDATGRPKSKLQKTATKFQSFSWHIKEKKSSMAHIVQNLDTIFTRAVSDAKDGT